MDYLDVLSNGIVVWNAPSIPDYDDYEPSHPWYYKYNPPMSVTEIPPSSYESDFKLPKEKAKRKLKIKQLLEEAIDEYKECVETYTNYATFGELMLSSYDRNIAHNTADEALRTSLALTHNHVMWSKKILFSVYELIYKEGKEDFEKQFS